MDMGSKQVLFGSQWAQNGLFGEKLDLMVI